MMRKTIFILLAAGVSALSACSLPNRDKPDLGTAIAQDSQADAGYFHQTKPDTTLKEHEFPDLGAKKPPAPDRHGNVTESDDPGAPPVPNAEVSGKTNPGLTGSQKTTDVPAATEDLSQKSPEESVIPIQPSEPIPTPPISEEPAPSEPPTESTPEPSPTSEPVEEPIPEETEPEFDVDYWVDFAISYGQQIGLTYDPGVTECWDNPIIASSNSIYLERDITSRLNRYLKSGMTAFGVWAQPRGGGAYDIYIAYA